MILKQIFKLLEKENELNQFFNQRPECLCIILNDYYCTNKEFTTYKQFVKYLKSEWSDDYIEALLKLDIQLNKDLKNPHKAYFTTCDFLGRNSTNSIEIYRYNI